ncbi:MAG: YggS family pyridoxal phosphate-dependent enzyme [Chitinophagales bacterium]
MNSRYQDIAADLKRNDVQLVVVSKTRSNPEILEIYNSGHRDFGENRVQELREKQASLPKDIKWHLIGHLQTNKVKYIGSWVHLIHSVDSFELLNEINKQGIKNNRVISCLLQVFIAREETKFGLSEEELIGILSHPLFPTLKNIQISGLMGMATNTDDRSLIRSEFRSLKKLFDTIKNKYFSFDNKFREISMGMSSDYLIAVEEAATMVRIGSLVF